MRTSTNTASAIETIPVCSICNKTGHIASQHDFINSLNKGFTHNWSIIVYEKLEQIRRIRKMEKIMFKK